MKNEVKENKTIMKSVRLKQSENDYIKSKYGSLQKMINYILKLDKKIYKGEKDEKIKRNDL